jgi:hypothetical protein
MDNTLAVQEPISPDILSNIQSYEDYLSFYTQLDEVNTNNSWLKADLLFQMYEKLGEESLIKMSKDLRQKRTTVSSYIRVARAFPPEKREPLASFSSHYQASYADSFNDQTKEFDNNKRFEWIKKAIEENLSTREIAHGIQAEKRNLILLNSGQEQANIQECKDKVKEINILLHNLLNATRKGDEDARLKVLSIYQKIYG